MSAMSVPYGCYESVRMGSTGAIRAMSAMGVLYGCYECVILDSTVGIRARDARYEGAIRVP